MIKPKFFLHRVALSLCLFAANVTSSSAATFEAGPGQTYTNLSSVPWAELNPGDTVNIHCQPGGYHEIILLSNSGVCMRSWLKDIYLIAANGRTADKIHF